MLNFRVGHGYDVHKLTEGRRLVLGGVEIPHTVGLLGHSDADVLLHALMDAMLGAAGMGDIGRHFPDTSGEFKDISSMVLLERGVKLVSDKGFVLSNADITVIAQKPKLMTYIPQMVSNIAKVCGCSEEYINVKATTEEHLGFTGRLEGISTHAVVLLEKVTK